MLRIVRDRPGVESRDSGVNDEDVQSTARTDHRIHHSAPVHFEPHAQVVVRRTWAELGGDDLPLRGADIGQRNSSALMAELTRDGRANPSRGASDQRNLAIQSAHAFTPRPIVSSV
jgi:hypothetical protein